jgi:hypothetical protein
MDTWRNSLVTSSLITHWMLPVELFVKRIKTIMEAYPGEFVSKDKCVGENGVGLM